MILRYLPAVALILGLSAGCNSSANKTEPPAGEAHGEHGRDDHAHGEHGHDDHAHGEQGGHDHGHEHEHGDGAHAKTYAEAVEKIETARNTIRDGLTGGEKEKADSALHEVGHLLEHVPELTKEMAEDEQAAVKKDLDELFGLYDKLDQQIHGDVEVTYDTWSKQIDEVVERLRSRVK